MELRDLIVAPVLIILLLGAAFIVRRRVTDSVTRVYFLPAIVARMLGSIALGLVYQFYYGSGDTFMYHTYGSRILWEAFNESPATWLKLLFADGVHETGVYSYSSQIYFFRDLPSYNVIRFAAVFDLLTFSSYSATAVLFSLVGFVGSWLLFLTFYRQYPSLHRPLAIATLFIPSVVFWGSGILKDTITLACIGMSTYAIYMIFIERRRSLSMLLILFLSLSVIYNIKLFILQAYLPASIVWVMAHNFSLFKSVVLKALIVPFAAALVLASAYYTIAKVGENDARYSVDQIARTAQVTAFDIRFLSGRSAGSGYTLDISDWTLSGLIRMAPAAVNVSLFRPYLWEVRNPLMLISSLESAFLLIFSVFVFFKILKNFLPSLASPDILFCLVFSISFAFATGISTFNFGTLARYRIPLLPFYLTALILMRNYSNRDKKLEALELTEK